VALNEWLCDHIRLTNYRPTVDSVHTQRQTLMLTVVDVSIIHSLTSAGGHSCLRATGSLTRNLHCRPHQLYLLAVIVLHVVLHTCHRTDWLIEQCLASPPTQYRLSGRQFYRSKDPTNSIKVLKEKNATKENPETAKNTIYTYTRADND